METIRPGHGELIGRVDLHPVTPVAAGSVGTWTIRYTDGGAHRFEGMRFMAAGHDTLTAHDPVIVHRERLDVVVAEADGAVVCAAPLVATAGARIEVQLC